MTKTTNRENENETDKVCILLKICWICTNMPTGLKTDIDLKLASHMMK